MVSTRNHPKNFPPPDMTPSKATSSSPPASATTASTPATARKRRAAPRRSTRAKGAWVHSPSHLTVLWILLSVPVVMWDTGYVLLRPYSMPGGKLHWVWKPYGLYGTIDYIYGWPAWEERNGFTAAQGWMNVVETIMYIVYSAILFGRGRDDSETGRGAIKQLGWLGRARVLEGGVAGGAALLGLSAAVMTLSKTVLYLLNEACSGFKGIGHNEWSTIAFMWILPNGLWILLPTYMTYVFSAEILEGLAIAAAAGGRSTPAIKDE